MKRFRRFYLLLTIAFISYPGQFESDNSLGGTVNRYTERALHHFSVRQRILTGTASLQDLQTRGFFTVKDNRRSRILHGKASQQDLHQQFGLRH